MLEFDSRIEGLNCVEGYFEHFLPGPSARCTACFDMRMEVTAAYAAAHGFGVGQSLEVFVGADELVGSTGLWSSLITP